MYYRCPVRGQYPGAATNHTVDVFVPEAPLLTSLDEWIAELFAPERVDERLDAGRGRPRHRHQQSGCRRAGAPRRARRKVTQYRAALDDGADPATVSSWITQAAAEERAAQSEPNERAELYAALGVEITYQPDPRTAVPAVEPQALGQARVGGVTCGLTPRVRLLHSVSFAGLTTASRPLGARRWGGRLPRGLVHARSLPARRERLLLVLTSAPGHSTSLVIRT